MKIIPYCDDFTYAMGVGKKPLFSWLYTMEPGDEALSMQSAWRIIVSENVSNICVWDSGWTPGSDNVQIPYDGALLKSLTRYKWRVVIRVGESEFSSETAEFITSILHMKDFRAKWIRTEAAVASPLFRREFILGENDVSDCLACVACHGYFEMHINGRRVGDECFIPARTDFTQVRHVNLSKPIFGSTRKSTLLRVLDLSGYIKPGKNAIAVWLGNGFFRQTRRIVEGTFDYGIPAFMLHTRCGNAEIVSDALWKTSQSPLIENNVYYGEIYDARLEENCFDMPNFDDRSWTDVICEDIRHGELRTQVCPPDRILEEIPLRHIGGNIYDIGENIAGFARITCEGEAGGSVVLSFAERLKNGSMDYTSTCGYEESDAEQIQRDIYILKGSGEEIYRPRFVWHGFRYVHVELNHARLLRITALRVSMDMPVTASLETSSDYINDLHKACLNTFRANMHGGTLCDNPHRERMGYTGDGQAVCEAVMGLIDARAFYRKWILDIRDAQDLVSGFVPHTAPFSGGGGGPAWGSAVAIVPWRAFVMYGDMNSLSIAFEPMRHWLDYMLAHMDCDGLVVSEEEKSWCLGDWALPSNRSWSEPQEDQPLPPELVNTCFFIICTRIYKRAGQILGLDTDVKYTEFLARSARGVNKHFLRNGCYIGEECGADAFALAADIVPVHLKDAVISRMARRYRENGFAIDTGMFGTPFVLEALRLYGHSDVAYEIVTRKEYPGFGYMLSSGATSIWETWEGNGSRSQPMFAAVDAWLFRALAGIIPDESVGGLRVFDVDPYYPDEMRFLHARMQGITGKISVYWVREDERVSLDVEVPFGAMARVHLRNGEIVYAHHGRHTFLMD